MWINSRSCKKPNSLTLPESSSYCWCKKSCTSQNPEYPIFHRVFYFPYNELLKKNTWLWNNTLDPETLHSGPQYPSPSSQTSPWIFKSWRHVDLTTTPVGTFRYTEKNIDKFCKILGWTNTDQCLSVFFHIFSLVFIARPYTSLLSNHAEDPEVHQAQPDNKQNISNAKWNSKISLSVFSCISTSALRTKIKWLVMMHYIKWVVVYNYTMNRQKKQTFRILWGIFIHQGY